MHIGITNICLIRYNQTAIKRPQSGLGFVAAYNRRDRWGNIPEIHNVFGRVTSREINW
jgi:hypothetical protein